MTILDPMRVIISGSQSAEHDRDLCLSPPLENFDRHLVGVPARAGRNEADVKRDMMDALAAWIGSVISCR